jgi:hypothetical protein
VSFAAADRADVVCFGSALRQIDHSIRDNEP